MKHAEYLSIDQLMENYLVGHWLTDMANFSAIIYEYLPHLNWAGFYLHNPVAGNLILGPFCGKAACTEIAIGRGVCGTAALKRVSLIVPDVHAFEGHIACDSASNSELVVPFFKNNELLGVFDLDSPELGRFGVDEELLIKKLLKILLVKNCQITVERWS